MRTLLFTILNQPNLFRNGVRMVMISTFLFFTSVSIAQISSTASGGDWSLTTTWAGGVVPSLADDVIIIAGANVTIRGPYLPGTPAACNNLTINGTLTMGAGSSTDRGLNVASSLTINPGGTLTNDGTANHQISVGGNFVNNGTFNPLVSTGNIQISFVGAGTQLIDGSSATQTFQGIVINNATGEVTTSGGTVTAINASAFTLTAGIFTAPPTVSFSGNVNIAAGTYTAGASTSIGGNFTGSLAASFVHSSGTVTFNGTTPQSIGGSTTPTSLNNVIIGGGADVSADYHLIINGNLTINDDGLFSVDGYDFTVSGTTTVGGGTSGTLKFTSTPGAKYFGPIVISSGGTWDDSVDESAHIQNGITNNGTFIAGSGQYLFEVNAQSVSGKLSIPNVFIEGGIVLTNNDSLTVSTSIDGGGTLTQAAGSYLNLGGTTTVAVLNATNTDNTVNYTGSDQTLKGTNYYNLILSGSGVKSMNTSSIFGDMTLKGNVTTSSIINLTIDGDLSIGSSCTFTNGNGINPITLIVKKSLLGDGTLIQANNSTLNVQGSASTLASINASTISNTVNYSGVAPAVVPGTYYNLNLNHPSGIALLYGDVSVNNILTISNSSLDIGNFNLSLGGTSILTITSPSATKMIITSGTGEVRKTFTTTGSYLFPIGENTGTVEYSPITVNVTSASGFAGYIGASVHNSKHPSNNSSTNYLNRYWKISQSGISNCIANINGTYFASDIVGTQANIASAQLDGNFDQITNGWKKYAPLGGSVTATTATLTSGQESIFTGINGVNPTVSIAGGDVTVCPGAGVSLNATATGDPTIVYSWSPTTGLSAANVSNPTATPTATTPYTLTIYDGNGITAIDNTTITLYTLPVVNAPSTSICVGATMDLTPNTGGTWASSDTNVATIDNSGKVTAVAAGTVTFTFTDGTTTCTNTTSSITVNALPVVSAPSTSICIGATMDLTPNTGGTWASSDTNIATVDNSGKVTAVATGSVTFTFTDGTTSCTNTTASITVNALPVVTAPSTSICVGATMDLTPNTGGTWASSDTNFATVDNSGKVTAIAAGIVTFTFTSTATSCSSATASITVNALPVVSVPSTSICVGATMDLTPNTGGTWASSDTNFATIDNSGKVTAVASGIVTFTFTDGTTGCSNTTASITVNDLPVVIIPSTQLQVGSTMNIAPNAGGTWTSDDTNVATVDNSGLVTAVGAGTVSFTFTSTATGCSNTTSVVTVNDLPTVIVPSKVCVGSTINATPSTGGTWVSNNPSVATIDDSGLVTGISAGTVTFTFTETSTSSSNTTSTVTVYDLPVVSAPSTSICVGSTIDLTPNTGGTWTSSDTNVATVDNSGKVTAVAAGAVTFTYTGTISGCSSTTASITVNDLPVISAPSTSICVGSTMNLTPNTGGTWTSSDTNVATIDDTGLVTTVAAGTVTFTFASTATGCSSTTATIAVNDLPVISAPSSNICVGSTMNLTPNTGGTWTSSDTNVATVDNTGLVTTVAAGTVTFTFTSTSTGCSSTTASITVNDLPVISVPSSSICVGATMNLTPNSGGTWTSSDTNVATVDNAGLVTTVAAGTVTFTFTSTATGCSSTTASITVNDLPVINAPSTGICMGATMNLTPNSGGTWTSSDTNVATVDNTGLVTTVATGNVTFTFTSTVTGCSSTTASITVNDLPVVSLSSETVRTGQTINAIPSTGGTWTSSDPSIATIDNSGLITGVADGNVTFTFTDGTTGCSNTTTSVSVSLLPILSVPSNVLCVGATMNVSPSIGGTWVSSDPTVAAIDNTGLITGVSAGTVTFTYNETSSGLSNTTSQVQINELPSLTAPSQVCVGATITLAPTSGGTWVSGDVTKATVTNAGVVTGVAAGSTNFQFTSDATGCSNFTTLVNIVPIPTKPTITASNLSSAAPILTSSSTVDNQWFKNSVAISGQTNQVLNVSADGSYTVQVTTNGCSSPISDPIAIVITGIEEIIAAGHARLYPNPAKEVVRIDWSEFKDGENIDVKIYDQVGRSVYMKVMSTSDDELDVRSFGSGTYVFLARQNNLFVIQRFIKE